MERAENLSRIDLTASELTAIAMRIEEAMEGRQGQRTDLAPEYVDKTELVPTLVQVEPGIKTIAIAAEAIGMKRETYRKAKTVVASGNQEEIDAMDTGKKSIHAAFKSVAKAVSKSVTRNKELKAKVQFVLSPGKLNFEQWLNGTGFRLSAICGIPKGVAFLQYAFCVVAPGGSPLFAEYLNRYVSAGYPPFRNLRIGSTVQVSTRVCHPDITLPDDFSIT